MFLKRSSAVKVVALFSVIIPALLQSANGLRQARSTTVGCQNDSPTHFHNVGFALEGYDIMKGYPNALPVDPGFKNPIFNADYSNPNYTPDCQYLLPSGFFGKDPSSCSLAFRSMEVTHQEEYESTLLASVKASGSWKAAFSANEEYQIRARELILGKSVYVYTEAVCYSYASKLNQDNPPSLSTYFVNDVKNLIANYNNTEEYYKFIDKYGTHVPREVNFGARYLLEYQMDYSLYQRYVSESVDVGLTAGLAGQSELGVGISLSATQSSQVTDFQEKTHLSVITIGSHPTKSLEAGEWAEKVKESRTSVPVKYTLMSISDVFQSIYFRNVADVTAENLETIKGEMENALDDYCGYLMLRFKVKSCEPSGPIAEPLVADLECYECINEGGEITDVSECPTVKNCQFCQKSVALGHGLFGDHYTIADGRFCAVNCTEGEVDVSYGHIQSHCCDTNLCNASGFARPHFFMLLAAGLAVIYMH